EWRTRRTGCSSHRTMNDATDNVLDDERLRRLDGIHPARGDTAANGREPEAMSLPPIDAGDLDLPSVSDAAWNALERANTPPRLFCRATFLSRLDPARDGSLIRRPLNESRLRYKRPRAAQWQSRKGNSPPTARPPMHVVRDMFARPAPPLPP